MGDSPDTRMPPADEWERMWSLFHQVREAQESERISILASAEPELRSQVEELLLTERDATAFPAAAPGLPIKEFVAAPSPGERIGPYRLLSRIGEGGMGVVFEADQKEPVRRHVALKLLRNDLSSRAEQMRFEAERQALALMDHSHIARVFDAGTTGDGRPWLAMEKVDGLPITRWCDERRLSIRERVSLFVPVCEAVQHAHQRGVLHRDLKPSNVLVTIEDGRAIPKVIDFGIAKALEGRLTDGTLETRSGTILGTPEYMSPEQASFTTVTDTRSDIYSLGLLLFELLTGDLPLDFRGKSLLTILEEIRREECPRPSARIRSMDSERSYTAAGARQTTAASLSRELQNDLDWVVKKTLEKEPAARYASAGELAADLTRWLRHEPVVAGPPSTTYRIRKLIRRHRPAFVAVAAVFVVLLLGLGGTSWMAMVANRERQGAETARAEAIELRDAATREAAIARATTQFVQQMLSSPDPWSPVPSPARPRDVKISDVLNRAAAGIDESFSGEPEVSAALRHTLGLTWMNLGSFDQARPLLETSLQTRRRLLGPDAPQTLSVQHDLAVLIERAGDLEAAADLMKRTWNARSRILGPHHAETLASLNHVAGHHLYRGEYDEAERLYRRSFEGHHALGPERPETMTAQMNIGFVLNRLGRTSEAEATYRDVLERRRRTLGSDHPDTISSMNSLAAVMTQNGQIDQALLLYADVIESYTRVLGARNGRTLNAMNNLAVTAWKADRHEEAERRFRTVLAGYEETLGGRHPKALVTRNNLARVLVDRGKLEEAAARYRDLLRDAGEVLPQGHWNLSSYWMGYGLCLMEMKRYSDAERYLSRAHDRLQAEFGNEDPRTKKAVERLRELDRRRS